MLSSVDHEQSFTTTRPDTPVTVLSQSNSSNTPYITRSGREVKIKRRYIDNNWITDLIMLQIICGKFVDIETGICGITIKHVCCHYCLFYVIYLGNKETQHLLQIIVSMQCNTSR